MNPARFSLKKHHKHCSHLCIIHDRNFIMWRASYVLIDQSYDLQFTVKKCKSQKNVGICITGLECIGYHIHPILWVCLLLIRRTLFLNFSHNLFWFHFLYLRILNDLFKTSCTWIWFTTYSMPFTQPSCCNFRISPWNEHIELTAFH